MKELVPYFVKFDKNSQMILNIYLSNCKIKKDKY